MKATEAKKEILKLFEDAKDEEAVSLWHKILSENQSMIVSQHVFNTVIHQIGLSGWNSRGKFGRLYSIACKMINSGLFALLNGCRFMAENKKSRNCLRFIIAAILTKGDTLSFNKFIKELYVGCSYDEFKNILQDAIFVAENKFMMFSSPESIKIINNTILEGDLLNEADKVLFTLRTYSLNMTKSHQSVDVMNLIEDYWDNEEIKIEAIEFLLQDSLLDNKLNIVRIFSIDECLLSAMYQRKCLRGDKFSILMFEDRFRKQVFDRIFQYNDNEFIESVIDFIHECYEIWDFRGDIIKRPLQERCWYEELKKCVLEYNSSNVDIIEKTLSEMFSYKSKNILKFFIGNNNNKLISFRHEYNRPIFEAYLKYRIEDLYKYIETEEEYYNYIAKLYTYIDDSCDNKRSVLEETYRYFVNSKQTWRIIETIQAILQYDETFAKEIIIDLICNGTDDRFQITSYYNPTRMHDVFGTLNSYFKFANVYELLNEEFIFKKKAFRNAIDYFEYTLSFDSDWSVRDLIYEEIFFVTEDLNSVFDLYIKFSEKIYGASTYFTEIENIANRKEFTGDKKEQIIKGFTKVYHHLININFKYIDSFKDNITKFFYI